MAKKEAAVPFTENEYRLEYRLIEHSDGDGWAVILTTPDRCTTIRCASRIDAYNLYKLLQGNAVVGWELE